jgi:hypothetical protein
MTGFKDRKHETDTGLLMKESIMVKARLLRCALLALGIAALSAPAHAIECDGNFQIQKSGNLIATPYCQDQYLAEVAQEYGMRVSGTEIRNNYSLKSKACRLVGYDNRVRDTCSQYLYKNRKGRCAFIPC